MFSDSGNEALTMISAFVLLIGLVIYFSGIILKDRPVERPEGVSQESADKAKKQIKEKGWFIK